MYTEKTFMNCCLFKIGFIWNFKDVGLSINIFGIGSGSEVKALWLKDSRFQKYSTFYAPMKKFHNAEKKGKYYTFWGQNMLSNMCVI